MRFILLALLLGGCASMPSDPCSTTVTNEYIIEQVESPDKSDAYLEILHDDFEHEHMCVLEES